MFRLFFQSGKTVAVERGGGVEQTNLLVTAKHIAETGGWLHVFPEGRISYNGRLSDLRWGIGRMVCDTMRFGDHRCAALSLCWVRAIGGMVSPQSPKGSDQARPGFEKI